MKVQCTNGGRWSYHLLWHEGGNTYQEIKTDFWETHPIHTLMGAQVFPAKYHGQIGHEFSYGCWMAQLQSVDAYNNP